MRSCEREDHPSVRDCHRLVRDKRFHRHAEELTRLSYAAVTLTRIRQPIVRQRVYLPDNDDLQARRST